MSVTNLLGPTLRCSELEIRSDITTQLVFRKPDVLAMVTIEK